MEDNGHMNKKLWTVTEIIEILEINESFISDLEAEDILCPTCSENTPHKYYPDAELEKIRIAKTLMQDMEVNLPGVEIILRMRQNMFEMRMQFDRILEDMAQKLAAITKES